MRESVERQRSAEQARQREQNQRLLLWSLVPLTLVACFVYLGAHYYSVQGYIAGLERDQATRDAEFPKVLAALEEKRIIRETAENTSIRSTIYERTIAGSIEPPSLDQTRCNYLQEHHLPQNPDVFISKDVCVWPLTFEPELTSVFGIALEPETAKAFQSMVVDATLEGHDIRGTSGYRSYADQAATYLYWFNNEGYESAESRSAYPGYSEHQTGFAVDVSTPGCTLECFATTEAYKWMNSNAHKYGFIERYPDSESETTGYTYEPWHWRFIGVETAKNYHAQQSPTLEHHWQFATE